MQVVWFGKNLDQAPGLQVIIDIGTPTQHYPVTALHSLNGD
jgi:hypothetical protein